MRILRKKWIWVILLLILLISGTLVAVSLIPWSKVEGKKTDGEFIPTDGSAYVDKEGEKKTQVWLDANGKRFYVDADGELVKDGIFTIEGKDYLFDAGGALVTGKALLLDDRLYTAGPEGELTLHYGWLDVEDKWYYGDKEGKIQKNKLFTENGRTCYLDEEGVLFTGACLQYNRTLYIADDQGVLSLAHGWTELDGKTYFAKTDGTIAVNEAVTEGGKTYYLGNDGQKLKDAFYTLEDRLYYADANGVTRREAGWITVGDKEYCSDENGVFYVSRYIKVDGEKCFVDRTGAKIDGKPTIDQYLGCDDIYGWMTSHFSDYYFKTPYRDLYGNTNTPERLIMPYGEYGDEAGMNCTGFISSLVFYSGGDLSKVSDMGRFGEYGNADNYLMLATKGYVRYEVFDTVDELLASGRAKKGNIFYLAPKWKSGDDCHMAVFWGDTPSENKIWSQTAKTLCTVTEIYMVDPINRIYMFPIARNIEEE